MDESPTQSMEGETAPWLQIPSRAVSVVEHPCVIRNVDKGITSLGGPVKLSKALRSNAEPDAPEGEGEAPTPKITQFVSASLRPDDPFAKRLLSTPVTTNNLLLKVTVPKRTGRKRKRGSDGPWLTEEDARAQHDGANGQDAPSSRSNPLSLRASTVFRSIQDNPTKYTATPAGVIDESHRFRTLPDLQVAASRNKTMIDIKNNLMPLQYSQIKNFPLNTTPGPDLSQNIPPSAEFIQVPIQYNYKFQQNPFVKYTGDEREEVNIQKRMTFDGYHFIEIDADTVPRGPKTHIPPEHTLTPYVRNVIASIRSELAERPIITRHLLYNRIGWDKRDRIREAAVYCGYFFSSGPWREALIAWGLDPRKDPALRHFQTVSFQSFIKIGTSRSRYVFDRNIRELATMSASELQTEHTFDGVNVSKTGNIYQFCDISDPIIRRILDVEDIRTTCAPTFQGWYHAGTWAKATVILKDKMNRILEWHKNESQPRPDDSIYERVSQWPENWDDEEMYDTYREEMHDKEVHRAKLKEHTVMHMVRLAARNPRYAFEKIETKNARAIARENGDELQDIDAEGEDDDDLEGLQVPEDHTEARDDAVAIMNEGGESESDEEDEEDTDMEDEDDEIGEDGDENLGLEGSSDDDDVTSRQRHWARPS